MQTFVDSSALAADGPALRTRLAHEGYLFLPGLLPRDDVMRVHAQVADIAMALGWLARGTAPAANIADADAFCVDPQPQFLELLDRVNRVFDFNALSHHPALLTVLERLLQAPILVHPRPLTRMIWPRREEYTTPAHQDYPNIQGTTEVYTAWVPLMDCPVPCGGLEIARGSHKQGVFEFDIGNGAGGIEIIDPLHGQWVRGELRQGDVLLFHSMVVHRGVPNTGERLRMSVDARYQRRSDAFNADNATAPYGRPDTWDEVYADWTPEQRKRLAYYWRRHELRLEPFDRQWFDRRDALGFALGEQGDPRARSVLMRIAARDADSTKRERARRLLARLPVDDDGATGQSSDRG